MRTCYRTASSVLTASIAFGTFLALSLPGYAQTGANSAEQTAATVSAAVRDSSPLVHAESTQDTPFVAVAGGNAVQVSRGSPAAVSVRLADGNVLGVELPQVGAQNGMQTLNGTIVQPGRDASTAVQITAAGAIRALVTLPNQRAPKDYAFKFDLPNGFVIKPNGTPDRGLVIAPTAGGLDIASIGAPWAKDATGRSLATYYEIRGTTVVQHIDTAKAKYPVVADPDVTQNCGWTSCNWTFSRAYTKDVLKPAIETGEIAKGLLMDVCDRIPHPGAAAACGLWVAVNYTVAAWNVNWAVDHHACFVARFQYVGVVSPIVAFNSGWSNGQHCKDS